MQMRDSISYLTEIQISLVNSSIISEFKVIRTWVNTDDGYIRIRATLTNGDFLEMAEYFIIQKGDITIVDYRHHWTDGDKRILRKRWDNTPDHQELEGFPHHVHIGNESTVMQSSPMSIINLLTVLENEL